MVYKFQCCCGNKYFGQTYRHLKTRLKWYVPKCAELYIRDKPKKISTVIKNVIKRSAIAEHLVKNLNCAKIYEQSKLKILRQYSIIFDLVKLEVISIYLNKHKM